MKYNYQDWSQDSSRADSTMAWPLCSKLTTSHVHHSKVVYSNTAVWYSNGVFLCRCTEENIWRECRRVKKPDSCKYITNRAWNFTQELVDTCSVGSDGRMTLQLARVLTPLLPQAKPQTVLHYLGNLLLPRQLTFEYQINLFPDWVIYSRILC